MPQTIEKEVRKFQKSEVPTTTTTSLPMIRKDGTESLSYYVNNLSTCTVYANFKGCGINTAATGYWYAIGATATIAASSTTCIESYTVSALQAPANYITVEYAATATGGVSAMTQVLSVW